MTTEYIVSIVVPTFNRISLLRRCIHKIQQNVTCSTQIVVVNGASDDGTTEWLDEIASDDNSIKVIHESQREGAVKAFNRGFRAAEGKYVMWINDDAYPLPGSVDAAIDMIERPDCHDVGMVAFYHNWHNEKNVLDRITYEGENFELCNVRGYPYANFGLLRRTLLEKIGYADERYYFFAFDPDMSLKIQLEEGLKVIGCRKALIAHDELHDDRKMSDLDPGAEDNKKLFEKWKLPEKNSYPDPSPAYLAMVEERGLA